MQNQKKVFITVGASLVLLAVVAAGAFIFSKGQTMSSLPTSTAPASENTSADTLPEEVRNTTPTTSPAKGGLSDLVAEQAGSSKLVLSNQVSGLAAKDIVTTTNFNAESTDLQITVFLSSSYPTDKVAVTIKHLSSNEVLGPVAAKVKSDNGKYAVSQVKGSAQGWRPGEYLVQVVLADGSTLQQEFTMVAL